MLIQIVVKFFTKNKWIRFELDDDDGDLDFDDNDEENDPDRCFLLWRFFFDDADVEIEDGDDGCGVDSPSLSPFHNVDEKNCVSDELWSFSSSYDGDRDDDK